MREKIIGRQFSKRKVYISNGPTDAEQFFKKIADQIKVAGFPPYNFSQRLEFFKNLAKRILKKNGLIDQPHYCTKSEPDKLRIGHPPIEELGNIQTAYDALEPYVRAQGFEADSKEDLSARILDTIYSIQNGKDQEKILDDAFHLGRLVTLFHAYGMLSQRGKDARENKALPPWKEYALHLKDKYPRLSFGQMWDGKIPKEPGYDELENVLFYKKNDEENEVLVAVDDEPVEISKETFRTNYFHRK